MQVEINVSEQILKLDINPGDQCGCYIHKAVLESEEFEVESYDDVVISYSDIEINDAYYNCSDELQEWQIRRVEEGYLKPEYKQDDKFEPITIILDKDNKEAYIKGER